MRSWEELQLGFARIQAAQDCRNLMAKYLYYHSAGRHAEYVALWANREDCALRMPWGQYNGIEGVRQCYLGEHGTVDEAAGDPGLPFAAIHNMDTEIIEVAEDGQTAKGAWISPGHGAAVVLGPLRGGLYPGGWGLEVLAYGAGPHVQVPL